MGNITGNNDETSLCYVNHIKKAAEEAAAAKAAADKAARETDDKSKAAEVVV